MSKRKISGLIKYGQRSYSNNNKIPKFQEGGFAAVSSAYDWRDDPYELMLLEHKSRTDNSSIRANRNGRNGSNSGSSSSSKLQSFKPITHGLPAAAMEGSKLAFGWYSDYYKQVQQNGPAWARSDKGQYAYQSVMFKISTLDHQLKLHEDNFNKALDAIDEDDRSALALSASGNVMVQNISSPREYSKMSIKDYMGSLDKYRAITINDFVAWKKGADKSMNPALEDEFLRKNPVGKTSIYKTFIEPHEDNLQFSIKQNKVFKNVSDKPNQPSQQLPVNLFKAGLANMMSNGTMEAVSMGGEENKTKTFIAEAVNSVFDDIMKHQSSNNSRLLASLRAEVLQDSFHLSKLFNLKTEEERATYLHDNIKAALVEKVVTKGKASSSSETENELAPSNPNPATSPYAANVLRFAQPDQVTTYNGGSHVEVEGEDRVVDYKAPMIANVLSAAELNVTSDKNATEEALKNNTLTYNKAITGIAYTNNENITAENGETLVDLLGSKPAADFILNYTVITRGTTASMVMMPYYVTGDKKGKMAVNKSPKFKDIILSVKKAFKDSKDSSDPDIKNTPANKLLPGNIDPKTSKIYNSYLSWLSKASDLEKLEKIYKEAKQAGKPYENSYSDFQDAFAAKVALMKAGTQSQKLFNAKIMFEKTLIVNITADSDTIDIKSAMDKASKISGYGKAGMLLEASSDETKFIEGLSQDTTNILPDKIYTMNIFLKGKPLSLEAAEANQKMKDVQQLGKIGSQILKYINNSSFASNPNMHNAYILALQ